MGDNRRFLGGPLRGAKLDCDWPNRQPPERIHFEYLACDVAENAERAGVLYAAGATGLIAEYEFDANNGTYEFVQWTRRLLPPQASAAE